jgi:hypothetical protein
MNMKCGCMRCDKHKEEQSVSLPTLLPTSSTWSTYALRLNAALYIAVFFEVGRAEVTSADSLT